MVYRPAEEVRGVAGLAHLGVRVEVAGLDAAGDAVAHPADVLPDYALAHPVVEEEVGLAVHAVGLGASGAVGESPSLAGWPFEHEGADPVDEVEALALVVGGREGVHGGVAAEAEDRPHNRSIADAAFGDAAAVKVGQAGIALAVGEEHAHAWGTAKAVAFCALCTVGEPQDLTLTSLQDQRADPVDGVDALTDVAERQWGVEGGVAGRAGGLPDRRHITDAALRDAAAVYF
jgi:hypothetical protein